MILTLAVRRTNHPITGVVCRPPQAQRLLLFPILPTFLYAPLTYLLTYFYVQAPSSQTDTTVPCVVFVFRVFLVVCCCRRRSSSFFIFHFIVTRFRVRFLVFLLLLVVYFPPFRSDLALLHNLYVYSIVISLLFFNFAILPRFFKKNGVFRPTIARSLCLLYVFLFFFFFFVFSSYFIDENIID